MRWSAGSLYGIERIYGIKCDNIGQGGGQHKLKGFISHDSFMCLGVVYSGENAVCGVALYLYPHRAS